QHQPGELANAWFVSFGPQLLAHRLGAAVLPDDGAHQWLARVTLPHQRRFALVGDADGGNLIAAQARGPQRLDRRPLDAFPDLVWLVLVPPWLWEVLRNLTRRPPQRRALGRHLERRRPRRSLVDC